MALLNRAWSLTVGQQKVGITPPVRVRFHVVKTIHPTLNHAHIQLFTTQLPPWTAQIGQELHLSAGYIFNQRHLFSGQLERVRQIYIGKQPALSLFSSDGALLPSTWLNTSLAAGTPRHYMIDLIIRQANLAEGYIDKDRRILPRGLVLSSSASTLLDTYAQVLGAHWSIQDGHLTILKKDTILQGPDLIISQRDLVGPARTTSFGVALTCFLNPNLRVGGAIVCDQTRYKVIKIHFRGDTHEVPWYADVEATLL